MELKKSKQNYILHIPKNDNINISLILNRKFFNLLGFSNYHIYSEGNNEPIGIDENANGIAMQGSVNRKYNKAEEQDLKLATQIIGPEKVPNGYSQLPLVKGGGSLLDSMENVLSDYFHKYTHSLTTGEKIQKEQQEYTDPSLMNKDILLKFPIHQFEVEKLSELINHKKDNPITSFSSGFTYFEMEQLVKDLVFQLEYFQSEGVWFNDLTLDSIVKINDHFVIIDGNNMVEFKEKKQIQQLNHHIYKLLVNCMGDTRDDTIYKLPYSKLFYCLHRLSNENILLWI